MVGITVMRIIRRLYLAAAVLLLAAPVWAQSISILGDSYSTYEGRIPKGNAVWYKEPADLSRTDVTSVDQTWWSLLVKECGYTLLMNDSYSGSTISFTGYHQKDYSDRSFITRLPRLGNPDIILIFGCTNDSWAGVEAGEFKYEDIRREDLYTYRPALAWLLAYAKMLYPDTRIYFLINDGLREDITESTMTICDHYRIPYIQLAGIDKMAGHPSVLGMQQIAKQVKAHLTGAKE